MTWIIFPTPEELATWPAPNFVDPVTKRSFLLGIEIPLLCLVVLFIVVRLYSKYIPIVILKAMGVDDYMMLVAAMLYIANSIIMCISTEPQFATGYHIWDIPLENLITSGATGSIGMADQLLYILVAAFTKISILLTYLRLFTSNPNRYFCHTMLAFTAAWTLTLFPTTLFQCHPIQAYWLPLEYPNAKCLSVLTLCWTAGTLNVISDFLIFLWPASQLAKVQIALKERITLIAMFSLGLVICGAGVLKLWYTPIFAKTYDVLWHAANFYIIISVETSIGIVCGCLPSCRPFVTRILPGMLASLREWSTGSRSSKRVVEVEGQAFAFEESGEGIMRSKTFQVEFGERGAESGNGNGRELVASGMARADPDNISEGSEEWICSPQAVHLGQESV